jgi:hypothetical protein
MPKEIVVEALGYIPPHDDRQALIEITWQRDLEHVQVATYARHPETHETIGREEAMFVTLDRAGINRVIQRLRRARDQAFGKDE